MDEVIEDMIKNNWAFLGYSIRAFVNDKNETLQSKIPKKGFPEPKSTMYNYNWVLCQLNKDFVPILKQVIEDLEKGGIDDWQ